MTIYSNRYTGVLPAGDVISFGWHCNSAATLADENSRAYLWLTSLWNGVGALNGLNPITVPGVVITKVTTYQLDPVTFRTAAVAEQDTTFPGTSAAKCLPQDMSVVASLRTVVPGPRGRGRMYLPPPDVTTMTVAGELDGATQTIYSANLKAAFDEVVALGDQPCIFSRIGGVATPIAKLGVGTVLDLQRRRVNKVNTVRVFTSI